MDEWAVNRMKLSSRQRTKKLRRELGAANVLLHEASAKLDEAIRANENAQETITNLRDDAEERAAEISRAKATIEEQAQAIATFKEEHLDLMLKVAEMGGYINRVLEDDHVREQGPLNQTKGTMDDADRNHLIERLRHDDNARRQPAKPVRQGPASMRPIIVAGWDMAREMDLSSSRPGAIHRAPPQPKHWTAR